MNQSLEQIKKKIKSIDISYKITKAMQLLSTAKLKKLIKKIEIIKPYYSEVYNIFQKIIPKSKNSIYLNNNKAKNVNNKKIWVVFNSNLGLCGGFNNNLNKMVLKKHQKEDEIIIIGKKGISYFNNNKCKIIKYYNEINIKTSYNESQEISLLLLSKFNNKETNKILIAYTKYINTLTTMPVIINLLPIVEINNNNNDLIKTDFEPDADTVINNSIYLYVGAIIYGVLIESQVSENVLRRLEMENASNNAEKIKNKLLVNYNHARQNAITKEISEIISGSNE